MVKENQLIKEENTEYKADKKQGIINSRKFLSFFIYYFTTGSTHNHSS